MSDINTTKHYIDNLKSQIESLESEEKPQVKYRDDYKCNKCKYPYESRNKEGVSHTCPKCKSHSVKNVSLEERKEEYKNNKIELRKLRKELQKEKLLLVKLEKEQKLLLVKLEKEKKRKEKERQQYINSLNFIQRTYFEVEEFIQSIRMIKSFWLHLITWIGLSLLSMSLLAPEFYNHIGDYYVVKSFNEAVGISIGYTFFFGYPIFATYKEVSAKKIFGYIFILMLALWASIIGI